MKKTLIAALTTVFVSGNALAASPFDGLYGGLSVDSLNTTSETTGTIVEVFGGEDSS
ncbi:hypothetical protein [Thiomicrospira sp. ALE5]|uniref:hypothetical protein n=1 Tax=Thiomicrospira sp. ALE5 TaxID=748650 RepID=UPI0008E754F0|nr:hypothetical protein [Thiomicrospira sp. ALE5]SFR55482.1 hypothetical protein SAMN03092900_1140 [Thiomicrospira sp. ALE5]